MSLKPKHYKTFSFPAVQIFLMLLQPGLHSQTGPAGVETSATNVFWVKADAGTSSTVNGTAISFWNDQSGNGINTSQSTAAQQPLYASNIINGFPAIQFDNSSGNNDKLSAADNSILDNTAGYTFFMVTRPQTLDGAARCIVSKRTSVGVDQSFMHFYYTSNQLYTDIQTTNDRYNTGTAFAVNTNYLVTQQYDGTLASATRCKTYIAGSLNVTASESSASVPDNASPLIIGSTDANDPRPFGGYIAEIIIYRTALSTAPRVIVENYLSAKYNISISNDKYAGDNAGNGDYDREVAGVGRESNVASNSFSPSICAGLGISINSGLDNGDYILAGNAVSNNAVIITDVGGMTGTNNSRWQRIWYLDVTNGSTTLNGNISFDFSDAGLTAPVFGITSDYVLLYRAGTSGNWTELATASSTLGDVITFSNQNITADGYYTLGTKNYFASPLPLELIYFDASVEGATARLKWETMSEKNTSHFVIEQSEDAVEFVPVQKVEARGNSDTRQKYDCSIPLTTAISYLRLKSVDQDGSFKIHPAIALNAINENSIEIYPNPMQDKLVVEITSLIHSNAKVELCDLKGGNFLTRDLQLLTGANKISLDVSGIPHGQYLIRISSNDQTIYSEMLIK